MSAEEVPDLSRLVTEAEAARRRGRCPNCGGDLAVWNRECGNLGHRVAPEALPAACPACGLPGEEGLLRAAVQRVRDLHRLSEYGTVCAFCDEVMPCPTILALDGD